MNAINENIKKYRLRSRLSQKELAEKLNVSPKTVSKWETGAGSPDISQVVPLAQAFGISTDELLLGSIVDPYVPTEQYFYPRIVEYGIKPESIAAAVGLGAETVERAIRSNEFSNLPAEKLKNQELETMLIQLDSLIPRFLEFEQGLHMLATIAAQKLRLDDGIELTTIDKYAGLEEGTTASFLYEGKDLPPARLAHIIAALLLLHNTFNRDNPIPWA